MGKFVYKIKPGNPWDIGEQESWFSDMAAEGLILCTVGSRFAKFKKDTPQKIKYRIEVSSESCVIDEEQRNLYEENGWYHVDSWSYFDGFRSFHIFSSPEELDAPELHTDPAEQSYNLKDLKKNQFISSIIVILGTIINLSLLFYMLYRQGTPYLTLVNYDISFIILVPLVWLFWVIRAIKGALSLGKLKKNLSQGIPLDHKANWRKSLLKTKVFSLIYNLIFIILLFNVFLIDKTYLTKTTAEETRKHPIVTLTEMEDTTEVVRTGTLWNNSVEDENWYTLSKNFFSSLNYETREYGMVKNESVNLVSNVYQIRFINYVDEVVGDLVKRYGVYEDFTKIENESFDALYICEYEDGYYLIASKGRGVIYLYYRGGADLERCLNLVNEKLEKIK